MRCKVRTLSLNKRLAKALPHKKWESKYIPNLVGYVRESALDWYGNYALIQLDDSAFWCRVSKYAPEELSLEEITLY